MAYYALGIFGGMGTVAGAFFYYKYESSFCSASKQPIIYLYSDPTIPRKDAAVLEILKNRLDSEQVIQCKAGLIQGIEFFNSLPIDYLVIPCNTVHYFAQQLKKYSKIPILSIVDATCDSIMRICNVNNISILSTIATCKSKLYENKLNNVGLNCISLKHKQILVIQRIIEEIKLGNADKINVQNLYKNLLSECYSAGADYLVFACTELSIIHHLVSTEYDDFIVDSTNSLINKIHLKLKELTRENLYMHSD